MKRVLLNAAHRAGVVGALRRAQGRGSLAVLCYHRIGDPRTGLVRFGPMFSVTPAGFNAQLAWIQQRYTVVTLDEVVAAITGSGNLPDWPLLITFDDGYRDNAEVAGPILRKYGFPATVFLTTGILDGEEPLWWDRVGHCFDVTQATEADLPLLGPVSLEGDRQRRMVHHALIGRLKELPEDDKLAAVAQVPERLGTDPSSLDISALYLDWDLVRQMTGDGFSFGAHTVTHPILTRIGGERARDELATSRRRIEEELDVRVAALAYPNGQRGDFDDDTKRLAGEAGFEVAFSLEPGPARAGASSRDPFAVRRITIHHKDDQARFAAKLGGLPRLVRGG